MWTSAIVLSVLAEQASGREQVPADSFTPPAMWECSAPVIAPEARDKEPGRTRSGTSSASSAPPAICASAGAASFHRQPTLEECREEAL
jgi:hypothetical protein